MKYVALIREIAKCLPELREDADKFIKEWGTETPIHIFFMRTFNLFLENQLRGKKDPELLNRIFSFLEEMAISKDKEVRAVLTDTVLERIGDNKRQLATAQTYMKTQTRIESDAVERHLGRVR